MQNVEYKKSQSSSLYLTHEYAFVEKSQSEGESDIVRLANTLDREVAWLYDYLNSIWYNLPSQVLDPQQGRHSTYKTGLRFGIFTFETPGYHATIYHTHPKKILERIVEEDQMENAKSILSGRTVDFDVLKERLLKRTYIRGHFPSDGDIENSVGMIVDQLDLNLSFGIASIYGITYFDIIPGYNAVETAEKYRELINHIFQESLEQIVFVPILESIDAISAKLNQNEFGLRIHFKAQMK